MKRLLCAALAVLLLLGVCAGCAKEPPAPTGYPVTVAGVTLDAAPERVVTMSRALTAGVCSLGYAGRLVGVDDATERPAILKKLPRCGSVLTPDNDKLRELSPDLVLTPAKLPAQTMQVLDACGAKVIVVEYADSLNGALNNLTVQAAALCGSIEGEFLAQQMHYYADGVLKWLADGVTADETVVFLQRLPNIAATGDTWLDDVIDDLALVNGADDGEGWLYTPAEGEAYTADVIFCDENITDAQLKASVWQNTDAVKNGRVIRLDGNVLEAQSLLFVDTLSQAVQAAYPDADWSNPPDPAMEIEIPEPVEETFLDRVKAKLPIF